MTHAKAPAPSMSTYFWGDDDKMTKYNAAYFDFFKSATMGMRHQNCNVCFIK